MRMLFFFLYLFMSCCKNYDPLPLPQQLSAFQPIGSISQSSSIKETEDISIRYLLSKTTVSYDEHISKENTDAIIETILHFLVEKFGSPPLIDAQVHVCFSPNIKEHAVTKIDSDRQRTVMLDTLNLYGNDQDYIAHEFFHAFFEPQQILSRPLRDIEAWATYAQYLFKYQGQAFSNSKIKKLLIERFSITEKDLEQLQDVKEPWQSFPPDLQAKIYIINVLPFFERSHTENYLMYRKLIETP